MGPSYDSHVSNGSGGWAHGGDGDFTGSNE
jgi:hypothetical protein